MPTGTPTTAAPTITKPPTEAPTIAPTTIPVASPASPVDPGQSNGGGSSAFAVQQQQQQQSIFCLLSLVFLWGLYGVGPLPAVFIALTYVIRKTYKEVQSHEERGHWELIERKDVPERTRPYLQGGQ
eukprot:scaffold3191_cov118-Cylindrotheca_fusiformis.AAC.1